MMTISKNELTHAHGRVNVLLHLALNVGIVAVAGAHGARAVAS